MTAVMPASVPSRSSDPIALPLRVAFNASPLLSPLTGIGNYIVRLGAALGATGVVDAYSFYGYRWRHETPSPPPSSQGRLVAARVRDAIRPFVPFRRSLRAAQQRFVFARGVRRNAISLYHEPNYIPLPCDVPVVISVHDLSWLRYPETHPADRVRWLERGLPRALERAAAILVDSDFVRDELQSAFRVDPRRVHAVHLGVGAEFRPRSAVETATALHSFGLTHGDYLLTVGTIEPRKNLGHVLEAYARLPDRMRDRYPLVIAGAKGWRAADLEGKLRTLASRGEIRFLGRVSGEDLPSLYAGAAAFVFASLYEGFGLPPLEAMASGVPALVSDRGSLPEIAGDAAVIFNPEEPADTSAKIDALLADSGTRAELIRRGVHRAGVFTWESCARTTLDVYRAIR